MNKLKFIVFICLLVFSQNSYSFSCPGTNFRDKSNEGLRNYYQKEPNLVIFTGKILSIKKVKADEQITSATADADGKTQTEGDESNLVFQKVLTVETDKFWLGKPESKLTVNAEMNNGDDRSSLSEGDEFFFITRRDEANKLWLGSCKYSLFPDSDYKKLSDKFTEIFGEPQTSKK